MANYRPPRISDFTSDLYNVLGMNTDHCTQKQFFNRYVATDKAFMMDCDDEEGIIYFDDFKITIEKI